MGDVEILLEEDGNLKVVKHYNIRFLLRRLRGCDLQRRLVVRWWNCRQNCQDHTFVLKCLFVVILIYSLSRMFFEPFIIMAISVRPDLLTYGTRIFLPYHLLWVGFLFGAVFTLGVLMKTRTPAPPLRKEEIKSISGLIQHL